MPFIRSYKDHQASKPVHIFILHAAPVRKAAKKITVERKKAVLKSHRNVRGTYGMDVREQTKELTSYVNSWFK